MDDNNGKGFWKSKLFSGYYDNQAYKKVVAQIFMILNVPCNKYYDFIMVNQCGKCCAKYMCFMQQVGTFAVIPFRNSGIFLIERILKLC